MEVDYNVKKRCIRGQNESHGRNDLEIYVHQIMACDLAVGKNGLMTIDDISLKGWNIVVQPSVQVSRRPVQPLLRCRGSGDQGCDGIRRHDLIIPIPSSHQLEHLFTLGPSTFVRLT